jgi:hypothetical protein
MLLSVLVNNASRPEELPAYHDRLLDRLSGIGHVADHVPGCFVRRPWHLAESRLTGDKAFEALLNMFPIGLHCRFRALVLTQPRTVEAELRNWIPSKNAASGFLDGT